MIKIEMETPRIYCEVIHNSVAFALVRIGVGWGKEREHTTHSRTLMTECSGKVGCGAVRADGRFDPARLQGIGCPVLEAPGVDVHPFSPKARS